MDFGNGIETLGRKLDKKIEEIIQSSKEIGVEPLAKYNFQSDGNVTKVQRKSKESKLSNKFTAFNPKLNMKQSIENTKNHKCSLSEKIKELDDFLVKRKVNKAFQSKERSNFEVTTRDSCIKLNVMKMNSLERFENNTKYHAPSSYSSSMESFNEQKSSKPENLTEKLSDQCIKLSITKNAPRMEIVIKETPEAYIKKGINCSVNNNNDRAKNKLKEIYTEGKNEHMCTKKTNGKNTKEKYLSQSMRANVNQDKLDLNNSGDTTVCKMFKNQIKEHINFAQDILQDIDCKTKRLNQILANIEGLMTELK